MSKSVSGPAFVGYFLLENVLITAVLVKFYFILWLDFEFNSHQVILTVTIIASAAQLQYESCGETLKIYFSIAA